MDEMMTYEEFVIENSKPEYLFLNIVTEGVGDILSRMASSISKTIKKFLVWLSTIIKKITSIFKSKEKVIDAASKTDEPTATDTVEIDLNYSPATMREICSSNILSRISALGYMRVEQNSQYGQDKDELERIFLEDDRDLHGHLITLCGSSQRDTYTLTYKELQELYMTINNSSTGLTMQHGAKEIQKYVRDMLLIVDECEMRGTSRTILEGYNLEYLLEITNTKILIYRDFIRYMISISMDYNAILDILKKNGFVR